MSKKVCEVKLFREGDPRMNVAAGGRWACFALYCCGVFTIPLTLLWDHTGTLVGLFLSGAFLFGLAFHAPNRISRALGVTRLSAAEVPKLHAALTEYCRRLEMPLPQLGVMESPSLNIATYGFFPKHRFLVLTRGLLQTLPREELNALVARQLTYLWHGDAFGDTWLTQFLRCFSFLVFGEEQPPSHSPSPRPYSIKVFVRQFLLYPLALFPLFLLRGRNTQEGLALDLKTIRMTQKPQALAEGLRKVEAFHERVAFHTALSFRHLFLVPPFTWDPLGRVVLEAQKTTERIEALGKLTRTITMT